MNWLDWLIIAILVLSALQGMRCGLFVSVAKLVGVLSGLAVAVSYYKPLSEYLSTTWHLDEKILILTGPLLKYLLPLKSTVAPVVSLAKLLSPGVGHAGILKPAAVLPDGPGQTSILYDNIAGILAYGILEVITFLVLLLATALLVNLAGHFLTRIADISFLGPLNHFGGLLFGLFKGLLVVMIILAIISPFQQQDSIPEIYPTPPGMTGMQSKAFKDSMLLPYFDFIYDKFAVPVLNSFQNNKDLPGSLRSI